MLKYIYTWKYHKETPCVANLNKQTNKNVLLFFPFTKLENKISGTGPAWGFGTSGRREEMVKGHGRVNIVQILCTHV
jgi:hypothetical protein